MTHETRGYMRATSRSAVCGLCPWRNPCELGRKSASKIGSRSIRRPCCTILSSIEGIPSGRSLPLLFGIYVRRTAFGQYMPCCSLPESRWIRGRSTSSAVSLSTPGVRLPLFLRISSQAWLSHSSEIILSQSFWKRLSWFATASLCKCSISLATLSMNCSMVQPSAVRCCRLWNGWFVDPFALCPAFPDSLGGRHSTDYYGSAVPLLALATYPPTLCREPRRFRRCSYSNFSVSFRNLSVILMTCEQARETSPHR
jgi:hypothetical protein